MMTYGQNVFTYLKFSEIKQPQFDHLSNIHQLKQEFLKLVQLASTNNRTETHSFDIYLVYLTTPGVIAKVLHLHDCRIVFKGQADHRNNHVS